MSITLKELGERIRLLRGERSQAVIAAKAGIAQGYWSEIERGEKVPKLDVLFKIAKALGYDLHIFEEDSNDKNSSTIGEEPVWIDIVEPVACAGSGNGYHEISWKPIGQMPLSPVDVMNYSWHSGKMRIIRIEGSSMEPRYREGDRVLFSEGDAVSGDVAIILWDGRLYIRGYIIAPNKEIHLKAFNKENPEIIIDPEDPRFQLLGKVLGKVGIEPDRGFW